MLLLAFGFIYQNFEAQKVRSPFSPAPVWRDWLKRGLRKPEASKVELRKSVLERINLYPCQSEERRLGAQNTSSYSLIL